MSQNISIMGKIGLIAVILFSAIGFASANEQNVTINIYDTPIIGKSTTDIIKVNFTNFSLNNPYFITVFNDTNGNGELDFTDITEYEKNGRLQGLPYQIISVDWIPASTGLHWVDAGGVINRVFVSDTKPVYPVPELSTIALTSAGILGLIGLTRMRRND